MNPMFGYLDNRIKIALGYSGLSLSEIVEHTTVKEWLTHTDQGAAWKGRGAVPFRVLVRNRIKILQRNGELEECDSGWRRVRSVKSMKLAEWIDKYRKLDPPSDLYGQRMEKWYESLPDYVAVSPTARMVSSKPDLQQVPRDLFKDFNSTVRAHQAVRLVDSAYADLELRVVASGIYNSEKENDMKFEVKQVGDRWYLYLSGKKCTARFFNQETAVGYVKQKFMEYRATWAELQGKAPDVEGDEKDFKDFLTLTPTEERYDVFTMDGTLLHRTNEKAASEAFVASVMVDVYVHRTGQNVWLLKVYKGLSTIYYKKENMQKDYALMPAVMRTTGEDQ